MEVLGGEVEGVDIGDGEGIIGKRASSSLARACGDGPYAPLPGRNTSTRICAVSSVLGISVDTNRPRSFASDADHSGHAVQSLKEVQCREGIMQGSNV